MGWQCPNRGSEHSIPASLYGEITHEGVEALIAHLALGEGDVFAELGSGLGRCALQVFLDTRISHAIGVELHRGRHAAAAEVVSGKWSGLVPCTVAGAHCAWRDAAGRVLELYQGDILDAYR